MCRYRNKALKKLKKAGKLLKEEGFRFKMAYTSYLSRAIKTLWLVLEEMDQMYIPVLKKLAAQRKNIMANSRG